MSTRLIPTTAAALAAAVSVCVAEQIAPEDIGTLPAADVVFLGEIHDNPAHHANQASATKALAPKALVFEMVTERDALAIPKDARNDEAALARALDWDNSGWPDFAMYYPIFAAAPDASIFGGGTERDAARAAVSEGAAAAFGGGATIFKLDEALDDNEQSQREALQMAAHCDALPIEMLPGMVEAQRYRDGVLARAIVAAFAETGGPVVVITGNGHARRDWGVPRLLEAAAPELSVLTIGQTEGAPGQPERYDHWIVTDGVDREDPCAAFKEDN